MLPSSVNSGEPYVYENGSVLCIRYLPLRSFGHRYYQNSAYESMFLEIRGQNFVNESPPGWWQPRIFKILIASQEKHEQ